MFQPHLKTLPEAQQQLWPSLRPIADMGFVLYGGTAIALRLGHRVSIDFDFFHDGPLDRQELRQAFPLLQQSVAIQDAADTLSLRVPLAAGPVQVSFFGGINFGRVGEPERTNDTVLTVASPLDLFGTKLAVILQRVALKDYLDIAALLRSGLRLEQGLAAATALHGNRFSAMESVRALTWFEGADLELLSEADRSVLREAAARLGMVPRLLHHPSLSR